MAFSALLDFFLHIGVYFICTYPFQLLLLNAWGALVVPGALVGTAELTKIFITLLQVDGDFTVNENVCDIDGLNVASSAFQGLRENSANDLIHLPNNPYTPQQLFFINTAQVKDHS